jgi:Swt1-like HEPN
VDQAKLALFTMLGQTAQRIAASSEASAAPMSIEIGGTFDLSVQLPQISKRAMAAADDYRLFFVFEEYLRDLVFDTLSENQTKDESTWWSLVSPDIQSEVRKLEEAEELKKWMSLNARSKIFLLTLPQLLAIMESNWKTHFKDLVLDRSLVNQARLLVHLRNNICHMNTISSEESDRVKQVLRDWFRAVAP